MTSSKKLSNEIVYLQDKTWKTDLMSGLNDLRKEKVMCDITIKIGDDSYLAHKVVLGVHCGYFKAMYTSGCKETKSSEVTLQEGSSSAFGSLLRYAYTGNIRLCSATILDTLSLACYLQFPKAVDMCVEYIQDLCKRKLLSIETIMAVSDFDEQHDFARLAELTFAANDYLVHNFLEFTKMDCFLQLQSAECIVRFLQSPSIAKLQSKNEGEILDAVLAWLKHDWPKRKVDAMKLLREVRLGLVPKEHLHRKITEFNMMPEVTKLLRAVADLLEDVGDQHPLTLAREYPKLCATRTQVTAPLVAYGENASWYYDKVKKDWVRVPFCGPQINGKRHSTIDHTLLVANEDLYSAGGLYRTDKSGWREIKTKNFSVYSPRLNDWTGLENMKVARSWCTLVALDDYIYAIGGVNEASVERYSFKSGKWSEPGEIAPLPVQRTCRSMSAVGFEGRILVYANPGFYLYDPKSNMWYDQKLLGGVISSQAKPNKKKLIPLLMVHNSQCFLVSYTHIHVVNESDVLMTKPVVTLLSFSTSDLRAKTDIVDITSIQSQKLVPLNSSGAFIIDDEVFVSVNGCVHNTGIFVEESQTEMVNLDEWEKLTGRRTFVSYTFDKLCLRKK
ncbi:kelch-like protein 15 [Amphiura filiformis]|uniref:kelch-like protein 15 n=1 Tax=Amphiura filiformis TaxID=82378 RepID=UPI003B2141A2